MSRKKRLPRAEYAEGADLLRVISIGMVAWYHIWQQSWLPPVLKIGALKISLEPWVRSGYMLVDIMLMLSGFLLYLPYADHRERPLKDYYFRRAKRILPSYWFCLIVMLIYARRVDGIGWNALWKDLITHLTFTHNLFPETYVGSRLNVVLWTLAVEVQFYIILPPLAEAFRKRPLLIYGIMCLTALCARVFWTGPMTNTTYFVNRLPNMLSVYANGMMAAELYVRLTKRKRRRWIAPAGLFGMLIGAAILIEIMRVQARNTDYELLRHGQLKWRWLYSAAAALMLTGGSLTYAPVRRLISNRVTRFLSGLTYNFYIWHQWLAVRLKEWRIPGYLAEANPNYVYEQPWQRRYTLCCFAAALLASLLVTYLIEKPCAKIGRKRHG